MLVWSFKQKATTILYNNIIFNYHLLIFQFFFLCHFLQNLKFLAYQFYLLLINFISIRVWSRIKDHYALFLELQKLVKILLTIFQSLQLTYMSPKWLKESTPGCLQYNLKDNITLGFRVRWLFHKTTAEQVTLRMTLPFLYHCQGKLLLKFSYK